ncbi:N-glycosylase/DNA lyase [Dethiosulfatibacter aminovorans DSM 17477]|uniref:DNA-(apurinic or apyrimidinic site) lyase n=1 Tax=Dethiosulfatibacter aminovorans DSM 17477 TaxID=1121476 RepID=A0A1M6DPN1_9FIRM|nr:N-glycosylase/DNA lyase [Dethiosulfatibacter aminovorans DSM 17477]
MIIKYYEDRVEIENINDFIPRHVFDCGQCFRWTEEEDGSYTGVAYKKVVNIGMFGDKLVINNTNKQDFDNIWNDYLDLTRDYGRIKSHIDIDEHMHKAIGFGRGIRTLNQDEWEILITFIISANNRIPMIRNAVENLSEKYGEEIGEYRGRKYYAFPTPQAIAKANLEDIRNCKVGFRDKYILAAAKHIEKNMEWLYSIKEFDYEAASRELKKLKGVGDKVAHCILLFSMGKYSAFPVDVWIKRIMTTLYGDEIEGNGIGEFASSNFGEYAGFAQQYLFFYGRENNVGKNNEKRSKMK